MSLIVDSEAEAEARVVSEIVAPEEDAQPVNYYFYFLPPFFSCHQSRISLVLGYGLWASWLIHLAPSARDSTDTSVVIVPILAGKYNCRNCPTPLDTYSIIKLAGAVQKGDSLCYI